MRDGIGKKIEEIRQKPEHVRIWYVWAAVGVVMFFVILIWIFTLKENLGKSAPAGELEVLQERLPLGKGALEKEESIETLFQDPNAARSGGFEEGATK